MITGRCLSLIVIPLLLGNQGGCASSPVSPPVVVRLTPDLPAECVAPALVRPALPDRDIVLDDADLVARDRKALAGAFDRSEALRSICRAALERQGKGG